jgi:hypothetical protein
MCELTSTASHTLSIKGHFLLIIQFSDSRMLPSLNLSPILPGWDEHFFWTSEIFVGKTFINSLMTQKNRALFVGRFEFDDIFGKHRVADFCWTLFMNRKYTLANPFATNFIRCPDRNLERKEYDQ